jgi:hypothetical protein
MLFQQAAVADAQMRVTVTGAQQNLANTQRRLDQAKRMTNYANGLVERIRLTNTPLDQAIKTLGAAEVQSREKELVTARFEAAVAPQMVAADHCVQKYDSFNAVQEAAAALSLSGFESVIIRPDVQETYQLLVPHNLASNALTALQDVCVICVQVSDDPASANRTLSRMKANGIHATLRLLEKAGSTDPETRATGIFVRHVDEESARTILEGAGQDK